MRLQARLGWASSCGPQISRRAAANPAGLSPQEDASPHRLWVAPSHRPRCTDQPPAARTESHTCTSLHMFHCLGMLCSTQALLRKAARCPRDRLEQAPPTFPALPCRLHRRSSPLFECQETGPGFQAHCSCFEGYRSWRGTAALAHTPAQPLRRRWRDRGSRDPPANPSAAPGSAFASSAAAASRPVLGCTNSSW